MSQRIALRLLLVGVALGLCLAAGSADQPVKTGPPTLHELSMEVGALQILYQMRFTPQQMAKLKKLTKETAEEAAPSGKGQ